MHLLQSCSPKRRMTNLHQLGTGLSRRNLAKGLSGEALIASAITFAVNSAPLRLVCGPLSKSAVVASRPIVS